MEATVTISGNVGSQVRFHQLEGGSGVASFPLACTPRLRREGEWVDGPTLWVQVSCWRVLAERVRDSVKRGDAVIVQGRLRPDEWIDESGSRRESLLVEATSVSHDLRRGTSMFNRPGRGAFEPSMESPAEAELADLEAGEERVREALVEALP